MDLAALLFWYRSRYLKKKTKNNDKLTPVVSSRATTFEICPNPKAAELK